MTDDLRQPRLFINRELSWLEFNARVLEEAQDVTNPLLERLKFLSIFGTNLDEFFMIRVANLLELEVAGVVDTPADGLTPTEQLDGIAARTHELVEWHARCLGDDVLPALEDHGIRIVPVDELVPEQAEIVSQRFRNEIFPVLTPLTVDPSHPFPHLPNLSLNLIVTFAADEEGHTPFAIVEIPPVIPPLIDVSHRAHTAEFVRLADVIRAHVAELFPGLTITGAWRFRVTRNSDLSLEEQEVENLLQDLERELRNRTFARVVRLQVDPKMPAPVLALLSAGLGVTARQTYETSGVLDASSLMRLYGLERYRYLRDPPFNPRLSARLATTESLFSVLRDQDLLLHLPYESFSTVVELLQHAAHDPKVLAIKLTLYRTSGDSVIIQALKDAAENGKQVTAVVELKARFDEKNNIVWARELERAGCHVVYGMVGLKTHCKAALVVRREGNRVRRYVHLATGNYNSSTARLYTDIGLLSEDPDLGEDVSQLFNLLTGYNARNVRDVIRGALPRPAFHKLVVSPFDMQARIIELIEDEIRLSTPEQPGFIQAKFNSLVDPSVIEALYRASCAGVAIRLCVRGICCLRPGLPGVSENVTVCSIVDRFLEHPRLFHFRHGGDDLVFASSADWMPRNLYRRIEAMFPIESPSLKRRVIDELMEITFADNVKARALRADGTWTRVTRAEDEAAVRSQVRFIELAREAGLKSAPYEIAVRQAHDRGRRGNRRALEHHE